MYNYFTVLFESLSLFLLDNFLLYVKDFLRKTDLTWKTIWRSKNGENEKNDLFPDNMRDEQKIPDGPQPLNPNHHHKKTNP